MQAGTASAKRTRVAQAFDDIDLGELGGGLWRRKRLIIGLTLAAAAIAFITVNLMTPRYKSEARVLIETRENIFLRPEAERTNERNATVDQEAVTSQVQLILSRGLALDTIRKLKLAEKPEFDPVLRGTSVVRTVLGFIGLARDPMSQTPEERVLRNYMERLTAFQVEKSRVIAIEFESQDPVLAAQVVNAIADGYLVLQQAAKREQTRDAAQYLAGEIETLRRNVAEAEAKVENYRANTNLMIGSNNTTLSNQQLGDFNAQLASARAQKAEAESKARLIREALRRNAADFSDIMNSESMRRLSEQRITLRAQLAEQSSTLLTRHPRIKELNAQISDLEGQIRAEAERLARAFENDAKLAGARVEALSASLDQLKRQAASTNIQDVQLRALERDAKAQRDLLESYLGKYREATARDNIGAASADARVISRGIVSKTPSWPRKLPTVLIAAFGMFILVTGFLLTGQLMSGGTSAPVVATETMEASSSETRVVDGPTARLSAAASRPPVAPEIVKPTTEQATIATEPTAGSVHASDLGFSVARPSTAIASKRAGVPLEAVEGLALALTGAGDSGRRIAMVGARRNMGTTLAAISLARALGRKGRTIMVDLALESPNLSAIASDANVPGISELVAGAASFGQIITRDRYSNVHLITLGKGQAGDQAMLSSPRLAITLEALNRSYDYVVLDAGALPEIAADKIAKLAPRAVLVADEIDGPATESAREQLLSAGFPNVSVLASSPQGPESDAGGSTRAAA
jgi:uncharacterized protein involved in exopolysaccharide biosynthesis/Mrp family chromosome partitioning ATPase